MADTLVRVEIDSAAIDAASGRVVRSLEEIRQKSVETATSASLAVDSLNKLAAVRQVAEASRGALEEVQESESTGIDPREIFSKAVDIVSKAEIMLEFLNLSKSFQAAAPGTARVLRFTRLASGLGLLIEGLLLLNDIIANSSRAQDTLPATLERINRVLEQAREGRAVSAEVLKEEASAALREAQEQLEAQKISLELERDFLEKSRKDLQLGSGFFEQESVQSNARRNIAEAEATIRELEGRIGLLRTNIGALERLIDDLSSDSSLPPTPARKPEEIIQMGQTASPLAPQSPALGEQASPIQVPQSVCQSLEDAEAASQSFADAAQRAFETYANSATNAGAQVEQIIGGSLMSMENALVQFVQTGKLNFSQLVNSLIADLIRLTIRAAILGPLARALGAAFGGGGVGVGANVLSGGNMPFQPGGGDFVINGARGLDFTVPPGFPNDSFVTGLGLTSGERVSVVPSGQSAGGGSVVNVNVVNNSGAEVATRERPNGFGGRDIEVLIGEAVARDLRGGGPAFRAVRDTFGAGARPIGR